MSPFTTALRAAIAASKLTPYAVAKRSGLPAATVTRWLKGERDITLATADRIAAGLGLAVVLRNK